MAQSIIITLGIFGVDILSFKSIFKYFIRKLFRIKISQILFLL